MSGEYLTGVGEGFAGLINSFGEGGGEAFMTFVNSPALPILIAAIAFTWFIRRRR